MVTSQHSFGCSSAALESHTKLMPAGTVTSNAATIMTRPTLHEFNGSALYIRHHNRRHDSPLSAYARTVTSNAATIMTRPTLHEFNGSALSIRRHNRRDDGSSSAWLGTDASRLFLVGLSSKVCASAARRSVRLCRASAASSARISVS